MKVNGTLVNYYVHCKRQCFLHGNCMNLEDNSEDVKIGKAIHEARADEKNTELEVDNIKLDKLTKEYLIEVKKSDADLDAAKWQLLFYLYKLKQKGVVRKGRLEIIEKNRSAKSTQIVELNEEIEKQVTEMITAIEELIAAQTTPQPQYKTSCKKCAYYEYCYV